MNSILLMEGLNRENIQESILKYILRSLRCPTSLHLLMKLSIIDLCIQQVGIKGDMKINLYLGSVSKYMSVFKKLRSSTFKGLSISIQEQVLSKLINQINQGRQEEISSFKWETFLKLTFLLMIDPMEWILCSFLRYDNELIYFRLENPMSIWEPSCPCRKKKRQEDCSKHMIKEDLI